MSKHGQDFNEQFTSKEMFERGREYERERTQQLLKAMLIELEGIKVHLPDGTHSRVRHNQAVEEAQAVIQSLCKEHEKNRLTIHEDAHQVLDYPQERRLPS